MASQHNKYCPKCLAEYPNDVIRCPSDGSKLISGSDRDLVGTTIDERYKILSRLGRGGMGVVYVAEQAHVGRKVAVKVIKRELIEDRAAVARFFTEAKAIALLKSPHTVTLFDFGITDDGLLYYTMDLQEGRPLSHIIATEGALECLRASRIVFHVLDSLEEAHEKDILHRDLKPDNIFVGKRRGKEHAVVLDFGIAKLMGDTTLEKVTRTGMICGTPAYLSPEQALGNPAVPASDLYSLGVVFYEMLAGSPPFHDTTLMKILMRHLHEKPIPVNQKNPSVQVPASIDAFLQKALEKEPEHRFLNAEEFRLALRSALARHEAAPKVVSLVPMTISSLGLRSLALGRTDGEEQPSPPDLDESPSEEPVEPHAPTDEAVRSAPSPSDTVGYGDRKNQLRGGPVCSSPQPATGKDAARSSEVPQEEPVEAGGEPVVGLQTRGELAEIYGTKKKRIALGVALAVLVAAVVAVWQPWVGSGPTVAEKAPAGPAAETSEAAQDLEAGHAAELKAESRGPEPASALRPDLRQAATPDGAPRRPVEGVTGAGGPPALTSPEKVPPVSPPVSPAAGIAGRQGGAAVAEGTTGSKPNPDEGAETAVQPPAAESSSNDDGTTITSPGAIPTPNPSSKRTPVGGKDGQSLTSAGEKEPAASGAKGGAEEADKEKKASSAVAGERPAASRKASGGVGTSKPALGEGEEEMSFRPALVGKDGSTKADSKPGGGAGKPGDATDEDEMHFRPAIVK